MKKITVKIKAKDIKENNYVNSSKCAITKALHRAGHDNLEDVVGLRKVEGDYVETDKKYDELQVKVQRMYAHLNSNGFDGIIEQYGTLEPKDFQITFKADI